ncbi:hypothetical protein AB9E13_34935, partial [Rhizobium leguminosarum]
ITLKVFAGFVASLGALGAVGFGGAVLPLIMTVSLTGLEFLVAFLQAYVFAASRAAEPIALDLAREAASSHS